MTTVTVVYLGARLTVPDVLIDTGSASTIFAADIVAQVGLTPAPTDILHKIRGVGGMNYGFAINGILDMDYLTRTGAILNLCRLELSFDN